MAVPKPKELSEKVGISQSYASMILSDEAGKNRTPPRALAIFILRKTGWKHPSIASLTEEEISVLERVDPWQPAKAA